MLYDDIQCTVVCHMFKDLYTQLELIYWDFCNKVIIAALDAVSEVESAM